MKTLATIEEIFGPNHEVFIGLELTKYHEKHYKDAVSRLIS
jgi:16S rRNA C1402 (ribose-2'-O) methylase RsmI